MAISRRQFLKYCNVSAAALGLCSTRLRLVQEALANPSAPSVIWLIGSSCNGCSVSFLNRISDKTGEPATVADVVAGAINLVFHPVLMAGAGETAVASLKNTFAQGNYVLVLEGAVPTAFNGTACVVYDYKGQEVTFQQAAQDLASRAAAVVCVGTCAAFGGIPAAGANPTQAISVPQLLGRPTINLSGCPANPDWVVWAVVQLLLGNNVTLDEDGRPTALYSTGFNGADEPPWIHDKCPRNPDSTGIPLATAFGENGHCLQSLGCRGPFTKSRCKNAWNGIGGHGLGQPSPGHWCIGVNAPCQGCVEKTFPGPQSFFEPYLPE